MEQVQKYMPENLQRLRAALNSIECSSDPAEKKIKLLKNLRFYLLDDIHFKQQMLDNVDYSIYQFRKKQCEEEKK